MPNEAPVWLDLPRGAGAQWVIEPAENMQARAMAYVPMHPPRPRGNPIREMLPEAEAPPVDEALFRTLLESAEEIFESPAEISGLCALELHLKATQLFGPIFVVTTTKKESFDDLMSKTQQLGWGEMFVEKPDERFFLRARGIVRGIPVVLSFSEQPDVFDHYGTNLSMVRYTLRDGFVIDPRSQADLDNATVTCNKYMEPKREESFRKHVLPVLYRLTGKKFKLINKRKDG